MSVHPVPVLNVAGYRFVPLHDPAAWVVPLRQGGERFELMGTIIVATEGINLFLAGADDGVDGFLAWLGGDPLFVDAAGRAVFADLPVRRSRSADRPFGRLRVRLRPEIVTMRNAALAPDRVRAPAVGPRTLAQWLDRGHDDDGRAITLLDTRNAFEFEHGTFDGARHLDIARFEAFADAVEPLLDPLRDETVVTFCTGGIRCEKAASYMRQAGFTRVLQLDGGILGYFDAVGAAHWRGECFVFDRRVALDSALMPTRGDPAAAPEAPTRIDPD